LAWCSARQSTLLGRTFRLIPCRKLGIGLTREEYSCGVSVSEAGQVRRWIRKLPKFKDENARTLKALWTLIVLWIFKALSLRVFWVMKALWILKELAVKMPSLLNWL
jgi:hypothetical protein